jgi:hypothetical protein
VHVFGVVASYYSVRVCSRRYREISWFKISLYFEATSSIEDLIAHDSSDCGAAFPFLFALETLSLYDSSSTKPLTYNLSSHATSQRLQQPPRHLQILSHHLRPRLLHHHSTSHLLALVVNWLLVSPFTASRTQNRISRTRKRRSLSIG